MIEDDDEDFDERDDPDSEYHTGFEWDAPRGDSFPEILGGEVELDDERTT